MSIDPRRLMTALGAVHQTKVGDLFSPRGALGIVVMYMGKSNHTYRPHEVLVLSNEGVYSKKTWIIGTIKAAYLGVKGWEKVS